MPVIMEVAANWIRKRVAGEGSMNSIPPTVGKHGQVEMLKKNRRREGAIGDCREGISSIL
jgi:hypothetical protein